MSGHNRRTLTQEIANLSTLVIAMSTEHKEYLARRYSTDALLYTEACGEDPEPLQDVDDLFSLEDRNSHEAQQHVYRVVDQIIGLAPLLAQRIIDLHEKGHAQRE